MMQAMLFKEVPTDQVEDYVQSPDYVAEQKMDGARLMVDLDELKSGGQAFYQRNGQPMKFSAAKLKLPALKEALLEVFDGAMDQSVLDGELIVDSGQYRVWDQIDKTDLGKSYSRRRAELVFGMTTPDNDLVHLVRVAHTPEAKRELMDIVEEMGGEGVMFKNKHAGYDPGLRSPHSVKAKFVKAAEVVVVSVSEDPLSAELGVIVDDAGGMQKVGRTSLIGKGPVEVGDVIEINFLYWTGNSVYQPRMMRKRFDKIQNDCTLAQFQPYSREVM